MITADLRGKRALVTGGASGVGLATVEMLAGAGARVALNHRPGNKGAAAEIARLRAAGLDVIDAPGDVADPEASERMVVAAIAALGGLDILVNNAATPGAPAKGKRFHPRELDVITEEWWQEVMATNLIGPFRCIRAGAEALRAAKGAVVNVASIGGLTPVGSNMVYGASKAALIRLTSYLSRSLAPEVRVNAVAPGFIDTPWTKEWPDDVKRGAIARTPLKRACLPADIAEVIFFFAVGGAMVTGQTLVVDGGLT
ncbi:MAG TPA: SDR family oxidoreductase [Stellaceae bacterium]|nr:SDR family oxidoreductase [Stellaceae bacterium]